MSPREIANLFFDESIRVEQIIWLAANFETPCDQLDDFIENEDEALVAELLGLSVSVVREHIAKNYRNGELMAEVAHYSHRSGFLVKAATPIPTSFSKGGHMFSWGLHTTKWFYTEAMDSAFVEVLQKWKDAFIAEERAKKKQGRAKR